MQKISFNHDWRFYLGDPPEGRWRDVDDSSWRRLDLPHDWSIEGKTDPANPCGTHGGYFPTGRGWYRKTFFAPEEWRGKKILVEFEGVYMNAEAWLNEDFLGRHPYGYTSFTFDLTPYLKLGQKNALKVVVDNGAQLNSRWYSGSGIYRPAWLLLAEPVHLEHWGVYITTPEVSPERAIVRVKTTLVNEEFGPVEAVVVSTIFAPDGTPAGEGEAPLSIGAGSKQEAFQDIVVNAPALWSPETPALYRLETEVRAGGQVVDRENARFGIRSLHFDAKTGFRLNGQLLKLKGGCVHHDNGVLGATSYPRSEERKVELLKASGFNAIRCAHNPPAPAFLDACDRLGMLVIDEAFDCWREGKNPYDYHVAFDDWWQRDLDSMVLRDRNHPSVILWSIGNEIIERDGRSGGAEIAHRLAERVRQADPTRPVTAAICGSWSSTPQDWSIMDPVFAQLDVGGYNYQWQQYRSDAVRLPDRIICGLESFPMEAYETWQLVQAMDNVIGDFVWTSLDYLGESGIGRVHFDGEKAPFLGEYPWHQAYCGDLDLCGFKRPQSYYRDVLWGRGELYIAVHTPVPEGKTPTITKWGWPDVWPNWNWPGREGQTFKVDVYSPCEKVELFLNGRSLGVQPAGQAERFTASFTVPYEPGELKAVGYAGEKPSGEKILRTAGEPTSLRLSPDRAGLRGPEPDLCYVTVEITDGAGLVHPAADREIYFTVKGPGEIAAVGSGNPVSTESYRGHARRTFRGRCLVVVKSSGQPGEIVLRAQADGIEGAEYTINVR